MACSVGLCHKGKEVILHQLDYLSAVDTIFEDRKARAQQRITLLVILMVLWLGFVPVVGIAFAKALSLTPPHWLGAIIPPEKIPFTGEPIEWIGFSIMLVLCFSILLIWFNFLFRGVLTEVRYLPENYTLYLSYNGLLRRESTLSFDEVDRWKKERTKGGNQHHGPSIYQIFVFLKPTGKKRRKLLHHSQKRKVDQAYQRLMVHWEDFQSRYG